jgi:hypothetical protein
VSSVQKTLKDLKLQYSVLPGANDDRWLLLVVETCAKSRRVIRLSSSLAFPKLPTASINPSDARAVARRIKVRYVLQSLEFSQIEDHLEKFADAAIGRSQNVVARPSTCPQVVP